MTASPSPIPRRALWAILAGGTLTVIAVGYLAWPKFGNQCMDPTKKSAGAEKQSAAAGGGAPAKQWAPPPVFTSQAPSVGAYEDVKLQVRSQHAQRVSDARLNFAEEWKLSPEKLAAFDKIAAAGNDAFAETVVPAIDAALASPSDADLQRRARKVAQDVMVGYAVKVGELVPGSRLSLGNVLEFENMAALLRFNMAQPPVVGGAKTDRVRAALAR